MRIAAARVASRMGFREPAAKGATVRGIRPMATSLQLLVSGQYLGIHIFENKPFEGPVITAMGR